MDDPPSLPPRPTRPADAVALSQPLSIAARFGGPPGSGNGGYVAGRLANYLPAPTDRLTAVEITLRKPPPLLVDLLVQADPDVDSGSFSATQESAAGDRAAAPDSAAAAAARAGAHPELSPAATGAGLRLLHGQTLVATARPVRADLEPVEPVAFAEAEGAEVGYPGLHQHPFPDCFVCGVGRARPDGLALRPGPLADRPEMTACTWVPDASLAAPDSTVVLPEMLWAALDCPGGWTMDIVGRPAVLGRMTAQIDALPVVGERCVVTGRALGRSGRKCYSGTTVYDGDGRVLARATAVWIEVDPASAGLPAQGSGSAAS